IDEPDGAVRADLEVRRPEVWIAGVDDGLLLNPSEAGAFVLDPVLQNALEADDIGDQEIALVLWREMTARKYLDARARARPLLIYLWRLGVFLRKIQMAGKERAVVGLRSRAVIHKVLPPAVPNVAMRVGKAEGHVRIKLVSSRLIAKDAGIGTANRRTIRRLDLRMVKRSFLEV